MPPPLGRGAGPSAKTAATSAYRQLLKALVNPEHERHDELTERLDG